MFRPIRRIKQAMTAEECISILKSELRGVLSVNGDDGYPYGVPMDYYYNEDDGHIYFHGSKSGHKVEAIARDNKVSFCVHNQGFRKDGEWTYNVDSVVVFGRAVFMSDPDRIEMVLRNLGSRYTTDTEYVEREIRESTKNVLCIELIPEHISGKHVREE